MHLAHRVLPASLGALACTRAALRGALGHDARARAGSGGYLRHNHSRVRLCDVVHLDGGHPVCDGGAYIYSGYGLRAVGTREERVFLNYLSDFISARASRHFCTHFGCIG
jgi:hypothetical protein